MFFLFTRDGIDGDYDNDLLNFNPQPITSTFEFNPHFTIRVMRKSPAVVWAGNFDEDLHRLITVFATANLQERVQLVSI